MIALQKKFETLTPNHEYVNFVNTRMEAAAECMPTKLRAKHRIPWETLATTNGSAQKLKKARRMNTDVERTFQESAWKIP